MNTNINKLAVRLRMVQKFNRVCEHNKFFDDYLHENTSEFRGNFDDIDKTGCNPNDDFCRVNAYGKLESVSIYDLDIKEMIEYSGKYQTV